MHIAGKRDKNVTGYCGNIWHFWLKMKSMIFTVFCVADEIKVIEKEIGILRQNCLDKETEIKGRNGMNGDESCRTEEKVLDQ